MALLTIGSAEVLSRIYYPTNPAAVDVYMEYHHRTRYSSVEFFYNMYYRVQNPVADVDLDLHWTRGHTSRAPLARDQRSHVQPNNRTFNLSASQVRSLHRVLFGKASRKGLANKVSVREMLRLLFASVGIAVYVATNPKDDESFDKVEGGDMGVADCAPMKRDAEDSDDGFANEESDGQDGFRDDEDGEEYADGLGA
ncbi:hypothetical protein B0H17DRAFT_1207241 [Mycena rosella]|uniref:Uncharacterized protein n=1 Tax=Mycena rosella TaxID=1033263 RepID=A0AAD7GAS6_MYCRO|nr:hypothetical protein B0H17DRAFT_1207241 [Mycena rosella]